MTLWQPVLTLHREHSKKVMKRQIYKYRCTEVFQDQYYAISHAEKVRQKFETEGIWIETSVKPLAFNDE